MSKKKKVSARALEPAPKQKWKEPRFARSEPDDGTAPLSWRFSAADRDGPFSWAAIDAGELKAVEVRLSEFEQRTWNDLLDAGCHPIETGRLSSEAQRRLREIEQDDIDDLMSFRITGPHRVWCIRQGYLMRVLWWDPAHQVYPTPIDRNDRKKLRNRK